LIGGVRLVAFLESRAMWFLSGVLRRGVSVGFAVTVLIGVAAWWAAGPLLRADEILKVASGGTPLAERLAGLRASESFLAE
jgi:hypothetical protein